MGGGVSQQAALFRSTRGGRPVAAVTRDPRLLPEPGDHIALDGPAYLEVLQVRPTPTGWDVRVQEIDPRERRPDPPYTMGLLEYWRSGGVEAPLDVVLQRHDGVCLVYCPAPAVAGKRADTIADVARLLGLRPPEGERP